jgi:transketolase
MSTITGYEELLELLALVSGDEKHSPSAHSTLDVLWTLYDRVIHIDPDAPEDPERDRFLLSKGHGPAAYYAVLAAKGFIDRDELERMGEFDSLLGHHPDRNLIPGVEISSGSLGHGLPIAVGVALALERRGLERPRVFCLLGDGELDEGSNHEAIQLAGRLKLDTLTAIVVDNDSSTHGWPDGIERRFALEGWEPFVVDGRNHDELERAFTAPRHGLPRVVVARVEKRR